MPTSSLINWANRFPIRVKESPTSPLGFIFHYLVSWVVRSIIIIIETHLMISFHYCIGFYFPLLSQLGSYIYYTNNRDSFNELSLTLSNGPFCNAIYRPRNPSHNIKLIIFASIIFHIVHCEIN
jgi:hypothetical protein